MVRWYRPFTYTTEWGGKTLASRDIPQWCYDADAWIRARHVADDTLDAVRRAAALFGKGLGIHWYYWHNHPYDTHYPDYFPAQPRFAEMIRTAQSLGRMSRPTSTAGFGIPRPTATNPTAAATPRAASPTGRSTRRFIPPRRCSTR